MANVTDIETRVKDNTGRADLATQIAAAVQDALLEVHKRGNHYFMEELATRSLVLNKQDYDVPGDFKDTDTFWVKDQDGEFVNPPLREITFDEGYENWSVSDTGQPEAFVIYRDALWVFPPKPDNASETLHLNYYKFLPAITGNQTNELTTNWVKLIESMATQFLYDSLPNAQELAQFWEVKAEREYNKLVKFSNAKKLKTKITMVPRVSPRLRNRRRAVPFGGR